MTLSDLKNHFAVWNISNSYISENVARINYDMFPYESERERELQFQLYYWDWRTSECHM